jgi:hypothetical protein
MPTLRKMFGCFDRGYLVRLAVAMVVFVVFAFLARGFARGSAPRLALVVVEGLAIGYIVFITVRSIRRLDEMHQRIHLEAVAAAFALTGGLTMLCAMLEQAGAPIAGWALWVWPAMAMMWGIGVVIGTRRYR